MSLFCFCIIEDFTKKDDIIFYQQEIKTLAKIHGIGAKFSVDWSEPVLLSVNKNALVVNIVDLPQLNNCEMFLLPEGWKKNGISNIIPFRERMMFFQDFCQVFVDTKAKIDFYFGESGTDLDDFSHISLKSSELTNYLTRSVGASGLVDGIHLSVVI